MNTLPPKHINNNVELIKQNINVLLVDGNAIFKYSYTGNKNDYNKYNQHIGGVITFLKILRRLLYENTFNKVYVSWDGRWSGKLRYNIYKDYKGNRKGKDFINGNILDKQEYTEILQIKKYLAELAIRQFEHSYIESDDFIAYYCLNKPSNERITILTIDTDLLQLINNDVRVYLANSKNYITITNFSKFFKFHLDNCVLIKMICGDASDNIKGIRGVQLQTLLKYFPDLITKKLTIDELIIQAKIIDRERIYDKKDALSAIENIIFKKTDGIQGDKIYKINEQLINLNPPMVPKKYEEDINKLINGVYNVDKDGIKNVLKMMKDDGLIYLINEFYISDFLMPYKKLMEREKKLLNEYIDNNNENQINE